MKSTVYNQEGKEVGTIEVPERVFGLPWNADLVHQVVVSMQANARTPVAHTHDRSEQSGGGRKPWRQKGTGRARHGSRRSPLWRGGGVTFGPRNEKSYKKKINSKVRTKALYTALSRKLKDGEVIFLDALSVAEPKTKHGKTILNSLAGLPDKQKIKTKKNNAVLVALSQKDDAVVKSFRNLPNVSLADVRNLNPVEVFSYAYLVIPDPQTAFSTLESKRGVNKVAVSKVKEKPVARKTTARKTAAKAVKTAKTKQPSAVSKARAKQK